MNLYYFLYYRIYKATYRTNKSIIEWSSMFAVSTLIYFNFISIVILVSGGNMSKDIGKVLFKWSMIGIIGINYLIFIKNKKYVDIVSRFKKNKKANSFIAGVLVLVYVFLSILMFLKQLGIKI